LYDLGLRRRRRKVIRGLKRLKREVTVDGEGRVGMGRGRGVVLALLIAVVALEFVEKVGRESRTEDSRETRGTAEADGELLFVGSIDDARLRESLSSSWVGGDEAAEEEDEEEEANDDVGVLNSSRSRQPLKRWCTMVRIMELRGERGRGGRASW
jgi:hypothetical protein